MPQTVDLSGLPDTVADRIQELVATIRQNMGNSLVRKPSTDEWTAQFRAWATNHPKRTIEIDDSRETIYAGRGE